MKLQFNRILSFLLVFVMLLTCIPQITISVKADYENTYSNTGDQRKDIVGVALTQVGYREGTSGFTKYGQWYGHSTMEWCAAFICWCANQANVPTSVIKKNGFAYASSFGLTSFRATERTPQPGDLFFRNTGHAGIVYYIEGNYFYTIEGNTWGDGDNHPRVMIRRKELYSSQYTFASPNYQGSSNASCSHSFTKGADSAHPHKEYYKCSKCGYSYYTGTNKKVDGCQDCCNHQFSGWQKVDDTYHSAVCTVCGKKDKIKHEWGNDRILQEANCKDSGLKKQNCTKCDAVRETTIPASGEHEFGQWMYSDNGNHYRICQVCETEETEKHNLTAWKTGGANHWRECEDCMGRVDIGSHQLFGQCGTACGICGLTPDSEHSFSQQWTSDETHHWNQCIHCDAVSQEADHVYSAECDESCDICGYIREVSHTYGESWEKDSGGHWKTCQKCGSIQAEQAHTLGNAATESSAQLCTVCGFEAAPIRRHIHAYRYTYDGVRHSGTCACGAVAEAEGHTWDVETGLCQTCQADMPAVETAPVVYGVKLPMVLKSPWVWQVSFYGAAAIVALVILVMLVRGIRRKIRRSAAAALRREFEAEEALEAQETELAAEQEPVLV